MDKKDNLKLFRKSKKYTFEEISEITNNEIKTIRTWRDLGVYNNAKTEVYRLKTHVENDNSFVLGRDLIDFFFTYEDYNGTSFRDPVDDAYKFFYGELNVSLNLDLQKEFDDFIVSNPFPNPFYPKTKVFTTVRVKSSGNEALNVIIVDALGQQVTKFNRITNEGNNDIIWEGDSEIGIPVASGPYYFLVNLNGKMYSRNLILLR